MRKIGGNAVRYVVKLAQDNMFLARVVDLMTEYIAENGLFEISVQRKNLKRMIKQYFRNMALDSLTKEDLNMGVTTPWGKDASTHNPVDLDFDYSFEDDEEDEEN